MNKLKCAKEPYINGHPRPLKRRLADILYHSKDVVCSRSINDTLYYGFVVRQVWYRELIEDLR